MRTREMIHGSLSILLATACVLAAAPAAAQTEAELRAAFEGKEVRVKIDMPGSTHGVDVYPQRKPNLKADEYQDELNKYGVAIRKNATSMVTKVKVNDKHIEFQLGGGGAGAPRGMGWAPAVKTPREVELELKPQRSLREEDELAGLRRRREMADQQSKRDAERRDAERRAREGSRFNIRYDTKITAEQMKPDAVRAALEQFVDFSGEPITESSRERRDAPIPRPAIDPEAEKKTKSLVVMIKGKFGEDETIGAGFIVGIRNDRMYIATADHVVRRQGNEIQNPRVLFDWLPGEWTPANLLDTADNALDLAVLSIPNVKSLSTDHLVFDRLTARPAAVGHPVFFIGYGGGGPWHTRRAPDAISGVSGETITFQSAFLQPGDSGGVLVSNDWRIIGMLRSDNAGEANALNVQRILDKLKEWNYPVALKSSGS